MTNLTDKQIKALPDYKRRGLEIKRDLKAVRILDNSGFTVDYGIRKFKQAQGHRKRRNHWLIEQYKQNKWAGEVKA